MGIAIDGRYIQDHFPGIGRYTYNLVAALARVAPNEKFIVLHNPALKNTRYDIAALGLNPNVELRRVDVPTFSASEQWALGGAIRAGKGQAPKVLHSPYFIKPYLLSFRSIVTIFDLIPVHYRDELPNAALRLIFRLAVSLAARTAAHIIVPSLAVSDDLVATLRVPSKKLTVIPLAADAQFRPAAESEAARVREKYSLPGEYVLCVGINKPHKNLSTLIQAWQRARLNVPLVIAGAWDTRYGHKGARSEERGGGSEIKWIRNVEDIDLAALYSCATVFVMPSLYEGFGLPLLEAMACGAPVIVSKASSLPEVAGQAASFFDPRDTRELATLISRVVNDRALQAEMRDRSLARAKEFSWERTARETLAVYRSVMK